MRILAAIFLTVLPLVACSKDTQVEKPDSEELLLSRLSGEYQPLRVCLAEKLGAISSEKSAAAIVAAGKLPELIDQVRQLVHSDFPGLAEAIAQQNQLQQASDLLDVVVKFRESNIGKRALYDGAGLLAEVSIATILSNIESVGCSQSVYLEYWVREQERLQLFIESQTEAFGLTECVQGPGGKYHDDWVSVIVGSGRMDELESLAVRVLGADNPDLQFVRKEKNPAQKAQLLMFLLAKFYGQSHLPEQSFEIQIRQMLGMNGLKLIYAKAKNLPCTLPEPNWHTVAWKYIEDHPVDKNPSPFINNKVDTL